MATLAESIKAQPRPYSGFDLLFINGTWRPGSIVKTVKDTDPYTGETLLEIGAADERDLDEAYRSAAKAQPKWAAMLPAARAAVFERVAVIMEARREEIVSWLVKESGSTRLKAQLEWEASHAVILEAVSMPYRVA
jgi:aldehyde dehydrogenase (NAD+)